MPRWAASSGLKILEEKTSAFHARAQGSLRKGDKIQEFRSRAAVSGIAMSGFSVRKMAQTAPAGFFFQSSLPKKGR
jgi:hypothetical protein